MAQSYPWLSLAEASCRLGIPEYQVLALAVSGRVRSRVEGGNHRELCAAAVDEFASEMDALASELAAPSGDVLAESGTKPTVRGGPELPADIEDEFQRGKDDA